MAKELYGVKVPSSLENDNERAKAYVAGFSLSKQGRVDRVPEDLKPICEEYAPDKSSLNKSGLFYPEITREESSFWAGYLTAKSSVRDKRRSSSRESKPIDFASRLGRSRRSLRNELEELSNE